MVQSDVMSGYGAERRVNALRPGRVELRATLDRRHQIDSDRRDPELDYRIGFGQVVSGVPQVGAKELLQRGKNLSRISRICGNQDVEIFTGPWASVISDRVSPNDQISRVRDRLMRR